MNFRFEQDAPCAQETRPSKPFDRWLSLEGDETCLFHREFDEYVVRFPDRADFVIALGRRTVTCIPVPDTPDDEIAALYFNQVVPLIMGFNGDVVLHASAVIIEGKAVGFLGSTGRGKSTLAAAFAKAGHPFVTDDGLILDCSGEDYLVRPRVPVLRLNSDSKEAVLRDSASSSEAGKTRISARDEMPFHDQSAPLSAIYLLTEPKDLDRTLIRPLSQPAALSELLKHAFNLDVENHQRVSELFHSLADIAERIACFELDYPRRYGDLPSVLGSIVSHTKREEKAA